MRPRFDWTCDKIRVKPLDLNPIPCVCLILSVNWFYIHLSIMAQQIPLDRFKEQLGHLVGNDPPLSCCKTPQLQD